MKRPGETHKADEILVAACPDCGHPTSSRTMRAAIAAGEDHAAYRRTVAWTTPTWQNETAKEKQS